jgi:hypothetical protein
MAMQAQNAFKHGLAGIYQRRTNADEKNIREIQL